MLAHEATLIKRVGSFYPRWLDGGMMDCDMEGKGAEKVNQLLETILESGQFEGPDGQLVKVRANIPREEGRFLQEVVKRIKPTVSLEVGLAYGISAMFICDALEKVPGTRHIVIDPYQRTATWGFGAGLHNLKKSGHEDIIEFHDSDSQRVLPELAVGGLKVDFAFIDGGHTFDHCLVDFFYIDRMLRVGGVVAFDDSNWPTISKVIRFVVSNRNYSVYAALEPSRPVAGSWKRRLLLDVARRSARSSTAIARLFKPNVLESDGSLGITGGRCIALKKENDDTRHGAGPADIGHHDF